MSEVIIHRIEEIAGASIGSRGEPVSPFMNSLAEKLLKVPHKNWVNDIRRGRSQGRKMLFLLDRAIEAQALGATEKDNLYSRIAGEGLSCRVLGSKRYPHRYYSDGFLEQIAENLCFRADDVSRAIKAMRVDLVYGEKKYDPAFLDFFKAVIATYFNDNIDAIPPSARGASVIKLRENWDGKSPVTFYRTVYAEMGQSTRSIGGLTPYDLAIMQKYYESRIAADALPTEFDREVIKLEGENDAKKFTKKVANETGIPVNKTVLLVHRNALVYGKPTSDFWTTN